MVTNIDRAILQRHEALKDILPGAAGPDTKILWVGMLNRPLIRDHPFDTYNLVMKLRSSFNSILENEIRKSRFSLLILPQDNAENGHFFDGYGNLTFIGKKNFWKFLNAQIKQHEWEGLPLKPWLKSKESPRRRTISSGCNWDGGDNRPSPNWGQAAIMSRCFHEQNFCN